MERSFQVWCKHCQEFHDVGEVEFLDVEEDITGRDVMSFHCPIADQDSKSFVVSR